MTLKPTKFNHPDKTVLALSAYLIEILRAARFESYAALLAKAKSHTPAADVLFPPAIALLFLLGLIEYRPKTDGFEYLGS